MSKDENIATQMAKRGMRIRVWALSKGLSKPDIDMLNSLSCGRVKGIRGRSKQLRKMLEADGFYMPSKRSQ